VVVFVFVFFVFVIFEQAWWWPNWRLYRFPGSTCLHCILGGTRRGGRRRCRSFE